jgi:hypothetical protein
LVLHCWYSAPYVPALVLQCRNSNLFSLCAKTSRQIAAGEQRSSGSSWVRLCSGLASSQSLALLRCDKVEYCIVAQT